MKIFVAAVVLMVSGFAHAEARLASYGLAKVAFNSGHAPSVKQLESARWMVTTVANIPSVPLAASGSYPDGSIPDGDGGAGHFREMAKITLSRDSAGLMCADATFTYTDALNGTLIDSNVQHGSLSGKGLALVGAASADACATRTLCRVLSSGTLMCAQISDDSRAVCTKTYKRGEVSAYLGYKAVHP